MRRLLIGIATLALCHPAGASSRIRPPDAVMHNICRLLVMHRDETGKLPKTWKEFADSGYFPDPMLEKARRLVDIENRYQFVELPPMPVYGESHRILIMAKELGSEGNNKNAQKWEDVPGRRIIYEDAEGGIWTDKVSEVSLQRRFASAGLDLSNYTSDAPDLKGYYLSFVPNSFWRAMFGGLFAIGAGAAIVRAMQISGNKEDAVDTRFLSFRRPRDFAYLALVSGIFSPFILFLLDEIARMPLPFSARRIVAFFAPLSIIGMIFWMLIYRDERTKRIFAVIGILLALAMLGPAPRVMR